MKINHLQRALLRCSLTSHQKITILSLVHLCDWRTWKCEASIKHLSRETGHPISTVKRTTSQLIELGLIKRYRQGDETGFTRSMYEICMHNLKVFISEFVPLAQSEPTLAQREPTLGSDVANPWLRESQPPRLRESQPLAQSEPCYQPLITASNNQPNISAPNNGHSQPVLDDQGRPPKPDNVNPYRWNDWKNAYERSDWLTNPTGEYRIKESHK